MKPTDQKLKAQLLTAYHHKLSITQMITLLSLYESSSTPTGLCRSVHLTSAAITGIIDKLQGLGFVRRRRSRHDRRIIKVTITELGKSAVDSIRDPLGWSFVH